MRCHVATFGCRVNQADSDGILDALRSRGLEESPSATDAEIVVINSCTVTHRSDADLRKLVHRVHRTNPDAKIIVTGCYAQRDPDAVARLDGTSAVVGTADTHHIGPLLDRILEGHPLGRPEDGGVAPSLLHPALGRAPIVIRTALDAADPEDLPPVEPVASVRDRTRPFIKIQEGCDAACTYCIIPSVRGPGRSARPERVIAAVEELVKSGSFEVVITGIHLGTYGSSSSPPTSLPALVDRLLAIEGLGRLRLSGIEPMAFPLELADLAAREPRLAPHFHLPLQSGSDRILKRMVRPYRGADFSEIIRAIKARVPHACVGTDVIVGFPGETGEDFAKTAEVVEASGVDYAHVFSYSDRPGAPATRLPDKIDPRTIKERNASLHEVSSRLWRRFLDRQVGRVLPALTLGSEGREGATREALSDNYCPIELPEPLPPNTALDVRVRARDDDRLIAA